jgi:hypothetical protein
MILYIIIILFIYIYDYIRYVYHDLYIYIYILLYYIIYIYICIQLTNCTHIQNEWLVYTSVTRTYQVLLQTKSAQIKTAFPPLGFKTRDISSTYLHHVFPRGLSYESINQCSFRCAFSCQACAHRTHSPTRDRRCCFRTLLSTLIKINSFALKKVYNENHWKPFNSKDPYGFDWKLYPKNGRVNRDIGIMNDNQGFWMLFL